MSHKRWFIERNTEFTLQEHAHDDTDIVNIAARDMPSRDRRGAISAEVIMSS